MKKIKLKASDLITMKSCPLCVSNIYSEIGALDSKYLTRHFQLSYPYKISLLECKKCGLIYKSSIPKPHVDGLIYSQYQSSNNKRWGSTNPARVFPEYIKKKKFNKIIEVGPGESPLINFFNNSKKYFVVSDKSQIRHLGQEKNFYNFYIDDKNFNDDIANDFDLLVMFDVLEHISCPINTFNNLTNLLTNSGIAVIESGLVDSKISKKRGVDWYYYNIPEHRVFFSKKSIDYLCSKFNFNLVSFNKVFHKSSKSLAPLCKTIIIYLMYKLTPKLYKKFVSRGFDTNIQPEFPSRDHFIIILKNIKK